MDTDELIRSVAYLRMKFERLLAERHRLIEDRHKLAAEALSWARYGVDLGPVYGPGSAGVPQNRPLH